MTNDDVLAQLRAADPARRADLSRIDDGATTALREGITMTARTGTTPSPARRLATRGVVALLVGATLLGGGAAYAAYQRLYVGGAGDGLTCLTRWSDGLDASSGGPALTGDPVADCQHYQELDGLEPITDPVAFRSDGLLFVAPRSQVPAGATLVAPATATDERRRELAASVRDHVDGLRAECRSTAEAAAFVDAELERLGLGGWRVDVVENPPSADRPGDVCADARVDETGADVVRVVANSLPTPEAIEASDDTGVADLAGTLRRDITEQCLALGDAERVAADALGTEFHWPLTAIPDPSARCTRVDLEVGGSVLVTLRGPEVATP